MTAPVAPPGNEARTGTLHTVRALLRAGAPPRGRAVAGLLLGISAAASTVALLACSGLLIDRAALRPPLEALTVLMATVQLLALGRGPIRYAERLVTHDAASQAVGRLRLWLYDRIEPRAPAGIESWRSGDILAAITRDVDAVEDLYLAGIAPLVVATSVGFGTTVLVWSMVPSAGMVLAGCLAVGFLAPPLLALGERRYGALESGVRGSLAADVVDLLRGAPELLALGCDRLYLDRILRADRELARLTRRRAAVTGAAAATNTLCTGAAVVGVLVTGSVAVRLRELPGPMLAVLPLVVLGSFELVAPVGSGVLRLAANVASGRRLLSFGDLPIPVHDPPVAATLGAGCPEVAFHRARLRYAPARPWVLDGVDLTVPPGSHLALVGASGSGKSTLVHVLMRFFELTGGTATVDGVRLGQLDQADVRRTVGLLSQDAHLFDTTIGANIALARPDATPDQIAGAARVAQLGQWLDTLPLGLGTPVGERGDSISGGQRQRIALARTLLAGSSVLLLDEPTAGLDEQTAERLLADIRSAPGRRTVVLVSHRRHDTDGFDRIAVLAGGRVTLTAGRPRSDPPVAADRAAELP